VQLRESGHIELDLGEAGRVELDRGRLARAWADGELPLDIAIAPYEGQLANDAGWIPVDVADELACVASWLDANAPKFRLVRCDGVLASVVPAVPSLAPHR
jgi:hypothetical protein